VALIREKAAEWAVEKNVRINNH
jgi:hypothetical protein